MTGGYYCEQRVCVIGKEYCDGEEVTLSTGATACMGQCTPVPSPDGLSSKVMPGIPNCISSADQGDKSKNNGCLYSLSRAYAACMEGPKFIIYNFINPDQPVVVSAYTMRDQSGDPLVASRGPFTACMDPTGEQGSKRVFAAHYPARVVARGRLRSAKEACQPTVLLKCLEAATAAHNHGCRATVRAHTFHGT